MLNVIPVRVIVPCLNIIIVFNTLWNGKTLSHLHCGFNVRFLVCLFFGVFLEKLLTLFKKYLENGWFFIIKEYMKKFVLKFVDQKEPKMGPKQNFSSLSVHKTILIFCLKLNQWFFVKNLALGFLDIFCIKLH